MADGATLEGQIVRLRVVGAGERLRPLLDRLEDETELDDREDQVDERERDERDEHRPPRDAR